MTTFRVWAPGKERVELCLDDAVLPMRHEDGWWSVTADGQDYAFSLDGGPERPDPRSLWQPEGVHERSRVYDHEAFTWSDEHWRGVPLPGAVLYELHVGTFTAEGTFDAAIDKLDHLVDVGVSAVQLLPCNAFEGRWGWGYDGVLWYAVHEPYGGPDGLKRLVDACHARGLGVVMDVVYNHLGPSGNYLPEFGPYLTHEHTTPWGPAVNLDRPGSDEVRRFIIDNALMWLRDYHVDGLRLDAVHALVDQRATPLLEELTTEIEALGARMNKPLWAVAESDLNDPRYVEPREAGGLGMHGQWCDDVHHSLLAMLTRDRTGYYGDFGELSTLAKAMTGAFVHDGTYSSFRGRVHGRPVPPTTPGHKFVVYLQNHDQVGNRALGDRPDLSSGLLRIGAALYLLSPFTPMIFMGEEYGATTPWQFFSDFGGELGQAVLDGRRAEFARHGWDVEQLPHPATEETFQRSKLDWKVDEDLVAFYRSVIALRRSRPDLSDGRRDCVEVAFDEQARWFTMRRGQVAIACNLSSTRQRVPLPGSPQAALLASSEGWVYGDGFVETEHESVVVVELA
jgi:maltooligosyltrehalose trehalohydrolase